MVSAVSNSHTTLVGLRLTREHAHPVTTLKFYDFMLQHDWMVKLKAANEFPAVNRYVLDHCFHESDSEEEAEEVEIAAHTATRRELEKKYNDDMRERLVHHGLRNNNQLATLRTVVSEFREDLPSRRALDVDVGEKEKAKKKSCITM